MSDDASSPIPGSSISPAAARERPLLITGGAGFIGSNIADSILQDGEEVVLFDNLSRPGVERNVAWLESRHRGRVRLIVGDVRDTAAVTAAVAQASAVIHLAAQVAVTTSLDDPLQDFTINVEGTLTVLEALRRRAPATPLVFASTNKVYGSLADVAMQVSDGGYVPVETSLREHGVDESRPLEFRTPYGCSKGAADQYVLEYGRSFGLRAVVLRMSCVYGPRQFGTEDQGWVAHFLIRATHGEPITVYGDGRQVRDILHVSDAVSAYRALLAQIDRVKGQAFNLGGGPDNAVSLKMVLQAIAAEIGLETGVAYQDWRSGDQPYFVANTARLSSAVGWRPSIHWRDGLRDLASWVNENLSPGSGTAHAAQRLRA